MGWHPQVRMIDFWKKNKEILCALGLTFIIFLYLLFWMLRLYPTLINDEYSALDFIYRAITRGELSSSQARFYKPYSLLLGFLAFAGGPFAFELVGLFFASALVFIFYLCLRSRVGFPFALLGTVMFGLAPDFLDNTVQGIVMIPGAFFIFLALYFATKMESAPDQWKVYSLAGFFGGLARPESWLLAFPLFFWLFPKSIKQIRRWILAPSIIGFSALLWFGKDWFLTGNIFNSFEVARYDRIIGTGAPSGPWQALKWFHIFLSLKLSYPIELMGYAGFILYLWEQKKKALQDPFLLMSILFFLFLYFSILGGLYPQMRVFFLVGSFMIFYISYLFERLWRFLSSYRLSWLALTLVFLASIEYFLLAEINLKNFWLKALTRTSQIQKDTISLAEYFRPILARERYRLLMPDREDDQFLWLLRDLPKPEIIHFREVHYEAFYHGRDVLDFKPDWIIWLPNVYQHKGVDKMFEWLSYQDQTELKGYLISLEKTFGEYRVFRVKKISGSSP